MTASVKVEQCVYAETRGGKMESLESEREKQINKDKAKTKTKTTTKT